MRGGEEGSGELLVTGTVSCHFNLACSRLSTIGQLLIASVFLLCIEI